MVANLARNRGLKVLLKTYAHQRRQMAAELQSAIEKMGGQVSERRSLRGIIHRGRMAIMGSLTTGPTGAENIALKEAMLGENAALKVYQNALNKNLPPEIKTLIEDQLIQIQTTSRQVSRLRGIPGDRLVVRLFNSEKDAETAMVALETSGFEQDAIEMVALSQTTNHYDEENRVVGETMSSGALGGAIWGSLLGAISGIFVLLFPGMEPFGATTIQGTWALIALSGTLSGMLIGLILGFFIGLGVAEEDAYIYDDSLERGTTLVMIHTNRRRAPEASQIMQQVNRLSIAGRASP